MPTPYWILARARLKYEKGLGVMTPLQIYMIIGALLSVAMHRFVMSGLRKVILDDLFAEDDKDKNLVIFMAFAIVAVTWPIWVIRFLARR